MALPITAIALVIVVTLYLLTVVAYLIYKGIEWAIELVADLIDDYKSTKWMKQHPEEVEQINKAMRQFAELERQRPKVGDD
ncbi:hypothetical protein [Fructobacillus cardui]|uniref:hypothetical protein n=1 Tax=Fructobacillus cardui TaxID=2893170 RepID=UPI002D92F65A|nr:unnamed protein product [Fructobacillus cardui]